MIRIEQKTPDWVYEFSKLVGSIDDAPLPEHVLQAKALAGHVAHVTKYVDLDKHYRDHIFGPVGITINRPRITVMVQYPDMYEHTFDYVSDLHTYIKTLKDGSWRFFMAFKAMHDQHKRDPEMEWFVGKPLNITKDVIPSV